MHHVLLRRSISLVGMFGCIVLLAAAGCSTVYYSTMSAFGKEKRDILVERVDAARDDQQAAVEEFQSALDRFRSVVEVEGGALEAKYTELQRAYNRSKSQAGRVSSRIDAVEDVAEDLFAEWGRELDQITDPSLRSRSESLRRDTRARYDAMIAAMRKAERSMQPVLEQFNNHVLYLKHNLNALAVSGLDRDLAEIEKQVASLIDEMKASIAEAEAFIGAFEKGAA